MSKFLGEPKLSPNRKWRIPCRDFTDVKRDSKAPFTRNNLLSNRLYNRFDNRLYRVNGASNINSIGCNFIGPITKIAKGCNAMSIDNFLAGYEIKYAGYGAANCTVARPPNQNFWVPRSHPTAPPYLPTTTVKRLTPCKECWEARTKAGGVNCRSR